MRIFAASYRFAESGTGEVKVPSAPGAQRDHKSDSESARQT